MGNSLHHKIYLGRSAMFASPGLRLLLTASTLAGIGLAWMVLRKQK